MNVLITGGAGFIGSYVAVTLVKAGHRVIVVDNFNDYYDPAIKRNNVVALHTSVRATIIEGDIRDAALMNDLMAKYHVTHVLHLAAMANVRASIQQPILYTEVNTLGTVNVLEAARLNGVENIVCASTSSVYGANSPIPFKEDAPCDQPLASYPASKRSAELLGHTFHHLFGLNITFTRFFNVYGPNGRPDMMPFKVMDAMVHERPITLFDGGTMKRDWTYIEDTANGIFSALQRPLGYEIINVGCGAPQTMVAFIDIMENLTGRKAIIDHVPAPPSDPPITYCDNTKARDLLAFDPQTSLEEGLAHTWAWYKIQYSVR